MKTRILALTAILVLAFSTAAVAATNKFSITLKREGEISGSAGKISFKVKTNKKGVATKITSGKISGLKSLCLDEDGVTPGPAITGKVPGKIKIKKVALGGKTTYAFQKSGLKVDGFFFSISGAVNKKGTKVTSIRVDGGDGDPKPPSCTARGDGKGKRK